LDEWIAGVFGETLKVSFEKKPDVLVGWLYFVFHAFLSFSLFFLFQLVCFDLDCFF